ncbi:MAG TPA: hypothetical protein VG013_11510 [Gemmataceae bacterium]|jgi:hypothetical protein|nr:hypothetical protein [Gemmataceae bacterium]
MMRTIRWAVVAVLLAAGTARAADAKYSVKTVKTPLPKELKEAIAKQLSDQAVQLLDDKGKVLAEVWLRNEVPAKATPAQVKKGLTYRQIEETTLLGAIRFAQPGSDYRKQKIKAGSYTLRLGFQPMDGDHMGTAPYPEFCLLVPASMDDQAGPLKNAKELQELSTKATDTSHPGILLLFPNSKPAATPRVVNKGNGHWMVDLKETAAAGGEKGSLGVGLVLIGHTSAE